MASKKALVAALVAGIIIGNGMQVAQAIDLGGILKGGIITGVVNANAPAINDAINKITIKYGVGTTDATKVVPIITVGSGSRAGAAQVSGPQDKVEQCKAALQIEQNILGGIRVKCLIPIDRLSTENIQRVQGVGVCAQIDAKI